MKIIHVQDGTIIIEALAKMFNLVHDHKEAAAMHLNGVTIVMFKDESEPLVKVPRPGFMPAGGNFGTD